VPRPAGGERLQSGHQDRDACEVQKIRAFMSRNYLNSLSPKTNPLLDASGLKFERVLPTHSPFQIIEAAKK
jgi:hypothetical protein